MQAAAEAEGPRPGPREEGELTRGEGWKEGGPWPPSPSPLPSPGMDRGGGEGGGGGGGGGGSSSDSGVAAAVQEGPGLGKCAQRERPSWPGERWDLV